MYFSLMSKLFSKTITAFFLAVLLIAASRICANSGATADSTKPVEAIKMLMKSDYYGNLDAIVSPLGCRFNSSRTGMQLLALPPDGRMYAFNDEAKKMYKVDMNRFTLPGLYRIKYDVNSSKGRFFATGKKAKIGGINAVEFANYRKQDLSSLKEMRIKALRSGHPEAVVIPSEIWASTEFTIPKSFVFIVSKMSQISEKELMQLYKSATTKTGDAPLPLRILRVTDDGRKILAIDTVSVKKGKATAKDFVMPSGYKSVSNELQLFMDDESMDFESLDSNPKTAPKVKTPAGIKLPF